MARQHIYIPDSVLAEMDVVCKRLLVTRSKFIAGAVNVALGKRSVRPVTTPAANDDVHTEPLRVVAPPAAPPPVALRAPSPANPDALEPDLISMMRKKDGVRWFALQDICEALMISPRSLLGEIDPDDDILEYQDRPWIDGHGVVAALSLCDDDTLRERLDTWAQAQL